MNKKSVFVICEYKKGKNTFREGTLELLSAAKELAAQAKNQYDEDYQTVAVVLDSGIDADFCELLKYGADKIIYIKNEKFKNYDCEYFSSALAELIKAKNPDIVLFSATNTGRELAPSVTSRVKTGLTADCTELTLTKFKNETKLAATRPTFGGVLMATILCKKNPQCATVREGVIQKKLCDNHGGETEEFSLSDDFCNQSGVSLLEFLPKKSGNNALENAKVILAGGKGLKSKENFEKLQKLAQKLNVAAGASRGAVDAGFAPQEIQIGQTGKTVAPEVYITFGISGAIHHISGMSASKTVVAINTDPDAPIFNHCDYKITADAVQIIDELLEKEY